MTLLPPPWDLQYILEDGHETTSGYSHVGFIYVYVDKQLTKPEQRALHPVKALRCNKQYFIEKFSKVYFTKGKQYQNCILIKKSYFNSLI